MIWGWHGYDYACITLILAIHINNGCGAAQEYYANTGALKNAAETAQGGKKVGCSIVETFSKSTKPRSWRRCCAWSTAASCSTPSGPRCAALSKSLKRFCVSESHRPGKDAPRLGLPVL